MIGLYGTVILGIMGMFLLTRNYKKEIRNHIYKGKLYFLSGLSMYIVDRIQKSFHILNNEDMQNRLQKLEPGKDSKKQVYLFWIHMVSVVILCIYFFMILGLFNSISICLDGNKPVTILRRPEAGEGQHIYNLEMVNQGNNDTKETISVKIDEYMMSEEEINNLLDKSLDYALTEALGENTGFDNITQKLDFSNRNFERVSIIYSVNEDGFLNENGEINDESIYEYYEKNQTDSVMSSFSIFVSYEDKEKVYEQSIEIKIENKENMLSYRIMKEINKKNSTNKKVIELPDTLDGNTLQFYEKKEKETALFVALGIGVGVLIFFSENKKIKKQLEKRNMQLQMDYSSIVCKLTLLGEAGSTLLLAWDKIITDYESDKVRYGYRYAYEEMKIARFRMKNGVPEAEAYAEFGRRCDITSYIKLGCLLEQNIKKGTKGLKHMLDGEVREAFAERKLLAKKRGEEASAKLLVPMMLMLVISMAVVVIPAFMSMNL